MLEELESPPYPGDGITAAGLFQCLGQLRRWVLHYRDDLNTAVGTEAIPAVDELPDPKAYQAQPVMTQYQHFMTLRRLREEWDHLVRTFEDEWDCRACLRGQAVLVQTAANLLRGAFTPYEVREANEQKDLEQLQRSFNRLLEFFRRVMEPAGTEEDDEDSDGGGGAKPRGRRTRSAASAGGNR